MVLSKIFRFLGEIDESKLYNALIRLVFVFTLPMKTVFGFSIIVLIIAMWTGRMYNEANKEFREKMKKETIKIEG